MSSHWRFVLPLLGALAAAGCDRSSLGASERPTVPPRRMSSPIVSRESACVGYRTTCTDRVPWPPPLSSPVMPRPPACVCTSRYFVADSPVPAGCPPCLELVWGGVRLAAWSRRGSHVALQFEDGVGVFELGSPEPVHFSSVQGGCEHLVVGSDADWIGCGSSGRLDLVQWGSSVKRVREKLNEPLRGLVEHDDRLIVLTDRRLREIDHGGTQSYQIEIETSGVAASDGDVLAVASEGYVQLLVGNPLAVQAQIALPPSTELRQIRKLSVKSGESLMLATEATPMRTTIWRTSHGGTGAPDSWQRLELPDSDAPRGIDLLDHGQILEWRSRPSGWIWTERAYPSGQQLRTWAWGNDLLLWPPPVVSPSGATVVVGGPKGAFAVDLADRRIVQSWGMVGVPLRSTLRVALDRSALAFHADTRVCWLSVTGMGGCFQFPAAVRSLAVAPAGQALMVETDEDAWVLDGHHGVPVRLARTRKLRSWYATAFSNDLVAWDQDSKQVVVWSITTAGSQGLPGSDACEHLASAEDGVYCVTKDGELLEWRDLRRSPRRTLRVDGRIHRFALSRRGELLAVELERDRIELWGARSGGWQRMEPRDRSERHLLWDGGRPWWVTADGASWRTLHGDRSGSARSRALLSDEGPPASNAFGRVEFYSSALAVQVGCHVLAFAPKWPLKVEAGSEPVVGGAVLMAPDGRHELLGDESVLEPWVCGSGGELGSRTDCGRLRRSGLVPELLRESVE